MDLNSGEALVEEKLSASIDFLMAAEPFAGGAVCGTDSPDVNGLLWAYVEDRPGPIPGVAIDGLLLIGVGDYRGPMVAHLEGMNPVSIEIVDDVGTPSCDPDPVRFTSSAVEQPATISGVVGPRELGPGAEVTGCGTRSLADEDGSFYIEVVPGRCSLRAVSWREGRPYRTAEAWVDAAAGEDLVVDLTVLPADDDELRQP